MRELKLKLKALEMQLEEKLKNLRSRYYDPPTVLYLFNNYLKYQSQLKKIYPSIFEDLPEIKIPTSSGTTDFDGRGYITRDKLEFLYSQIKVSLSLLNEAGDKTSKIPTLIKRLTFIIEEAGTSLSISGAVLIQYENLLHESEQILEQDFSSYNVKPNYEDEHGEFYGDGQLFRINSKSLLSLLQNTLGDGEHIKAQGAIDLGAIRSSIRTNLRRAFGDRVPKNENEVQDEIEKILNVLQTNLKREQDHIPISVTSRIPDFTIEDLSLAVEAKICDSKGRVKELVEEITSDITTYSERYSNILFVVYDTGGFVNDEPKFINDFESNRGVMVLVIKQ